MQRQRIIGAVIIVAVCAAIAQANNSTLFISGQQVKSDSGQSASFVDLSVGVGGIEFQVNQPAVVTEVGGVFRALTANPTLYGAVVPLTSADLPDMSGLAAGNVALLPLPNGATTASVAVTAPTASTLLQPGRYALVFGMNNYGASGQANILADSNFINPLTSDYPFVVLNSTGQRITQLVPVALGAFGSLLSSPGPGVRLISQDKATADSTITFETGSTGLPTVPGVHFLNTGNFVGESSFTSALFGSQAMGNLESVQMTDLGMTFDTPVHRVGFWVNDGYLGSSSIALANLITFRALDASGDVLYSSNINIPSARNQQGKMFVGLESDAPISRLEWLSNNSGFFAIDNVSYSSAPEPSSFVILGIAGAAMLCRRARRRA